MKKTFRTVTALALAAAVGLLTGCAANAAGTTEQAASDLHTVRVGLMTGLPDQYAVYIGTEEGIFEKYGIYAETNEYAAGINTIDAIANGTEDTGILADFAAVNRIGNTLDATNLVLFSELSLNETNNGGLYVPAEYAGDLKSLDGTEGWLTQIGTVWEYYNWQAQTYIGLDPAKQNVVQIDSMQTGIALAQQGGGTAVVASGANAKRFEESGWVLAASSQDIGIKTGIYLTTTREYLAAHQEDLANYLRALGESVTYINEHLEDSAARVEAKFGVDAEDFKESWTSYTFELGFTEAGAAHLDEVNAWAYGEGRYDTEYNIRDFIDTSAAEIAFPDNVTYNK